MKANCEGLSSGSSFFVLHLRVFVCISSVLKITMLCSEFLRVK